MINEGRVELAMKPKYIGLVFLPMIFILLLFFLVPLLTLILTSFKDLEGQFTIANYHQIVTSNLYKIAFKNSITISFFSALIGIGVGLLSTYSILKLKEGTQEKLIIFTNLTANFAGIPLAFAFIILLGNNGLFTLGLNELGIDLKQFFSLYSWQGIVLIYLYFQIPLAIILLLPIFNGIKESWKESALILGASAAQFWKRIGIPVLLPSILGTFVILFANGMGAYATIYALTGSTYNLVPVRIDGLLTGEVFAQPGLASALSVMMGLILVICIIINLKISTKAR